MQPSSISYFPFLISCQPKIDNENIFLKCYRKIVGKWKHIKSNFYAKESPNDNLESEIQKDSWRCSQRAKYLYLIEVASDALMVHGLLGPTIKATKPPRKHPLPSLVATQPISSLQGLNPPCRSQSSLSSHRVLCSFQVAGNILHNSSYPLLFESNCFVQMPFFYLLFAMLIRFNGTIVCISELL